MKKSVTRIIMIAAIIFSLKSCGTPEERATVVKGADSTAATSSSSTDSFNSAPGKMGASDSSAEKSRDTTANKKKKPFRHTPIDTITNLSDSNKQ